jgi:hypothetical protein
VFVLVELATLNYIDAALPILFQLFLAVIDPFFDVVETIASPIEKFRINVCPDERLDEFQLGRPIPDKAMINLWSIGLPRSIASRKSGAQNV